MAGVNCGDEFCLRSILRAAGENMRPAKTSASCGRTVCNYIAYGKAAMNDILNATQKQRCENNPMHMSGQRWSDSKPDDSAHIILFQTEIAIKHRQSY